MSKRILSFLVLICMMVGSFSVTALAEETRWQDEAPMAEARRYFGSAVVGNKIYVMGGTTGNNSNINYINTLEIYDTETGKWSQGNAINGAKEMQCLQKELD